MIKATNTYFLLDHDNNQFIAKGTNKRILEVYAKKHVSNNYLLILQAEDLDPVDDTHRCALLSNVFCVTYTEQSMPDLADHATAKTLFETMGTLALPVINKAVKDVPLKEIQMPVINPEVADTILATPAVTAAPAVVVAPAPVVPAAPAVPAPAMPQEAEPAVVPAAAVPVVPNPAAPTAAPVPSPAVVPAAPNLIPDPALVAPGVVIPVNTTVASPAPVVPEPTPVAAPLPGAIPGVVAPSPPAPVQVFPEPKPGHPTYEAMIDSGWDDDMLAANADYAYLVPYLQFPPGVDESAVYTTDTPAVPGVPETTFDTRAWLTEWLTRFKDKGQKTRFGAQSKNCGLGVFKVNQKSSGLYEIWVNPDNAAHFDCCKGDLVPKVGSTWVAIQKLSKEQIDVVLEAYYAVI